MTKTTMFKTLPAELRFRNAINFILFLWLTRTAIHAGIKVRQTVIQISFKRMIRTVTILVNQLPDKIRGECSNKCIDKNRETGQGIDNWAPCTNTLRHIGHGTALVTNEFNGINSNFQDSVCEGK